MAHAAHEIQARPGLENARKVKERLRVLMEEKPEGKFPLIIL